MVSEDETTPAEGADADGDDPSETIHEAATRYGAGATDAPGATILHPTVDQYLESAVAARDDGFDQLIDLTAVDYLTFSGHRDLPEGVDPQRFEVVTQLINHATRERLRLRVQVPAEEPTVSTLFDLWPGSELLEREVFDMFGITFTDHPDMSRVLMPEDWVGHPLRKDYVFPTEYHGIDCTE